MPQTNTLDLSFELLHETFQFYIDNKKKILLLSWPFLLTPIFTKVVPVLPFFISSLFAPILFILGLLAHAATIALILFLEKKGSFRLQDNKWIIAKMFSRYFVANLYFFLYLLVPLFFGIPILYVLYFMSLAHFSSVAISVLICLPVLACLLYIISIIAIHKLFFQFEIVLHNFKIDDGFKLSSVLSHKKVHKVMLLSWPVIVFFALYLIGLFAPGVLAFLTGSTQLEAMLTFIFFIPFSLFLIPSIIIYKFKLFNYLKSSQHYKQQKEKYKKVEKEDLKHLILLIFILLSQVSNAYIMSINGIDSEMAQQQGSISGMLKLILDN